MIVFCWEGFPQYAARCVGALVAATDERIAVVATRPKVPIEGMEKLAGCPAHWIDEDETRPLSEFVGEVPRLLVVSGWGIPVFNRLRDEVRSRGGRIAGMLDNNLCIDGLKTLIVEILKAIRFRLKLRSKYDFFLVPGKSSRRLLRFYGMPEERIVSGIYAADDKLFRAGESLTKRPKTIVYVGQLIDRKNVRRMCQAFLQADGASAGWRLELYGSGALAESLKTLVEETNRGLGEGRDCGIGVHPFLQPEELAEKYRQARAFCLPSVDEHWGLVVHEAALSGCVLLLSERVGARADFEGKGNVISFDPEDLDMMTASFKRLFAWPDEVLDAAGTESVRMGRTGASISQFVRLVEVASGVCCADIVGRIERGWRC